VLHFINDEIVIGVGEFQAGIVAIATLGAGVVDRLPIFEELNGLVESLGLVICVAALGPGR
jgi:hypothetical protein